MSLIVINMKDPIARELTILSQLKARLKLEKLGMKCRGPSATMQVKQMFNTKTRDRSKLIEMIEARQEELNMNKASA